MTRHPAVAGQFYDDDPKRLTKAVSGYLNADASEEDAKAILVPHAGYIYSGPVAGAVYSGIKVPDTFILIGPNHTGLGAPVSIMAEGKWEVPTGVLSIDEELSEKIIKNSPAVSRDFKAHMIEHSIEVQLPFIVHLSKTVKIVPISVMTASLGELKSIGEGIAKAVTEAGYPVVIAASSDMSHFETDEVARAKDRMAIDKLLALDPDGLFEIVRGEDITMCGYMPAVIMLSAVKALGATKARLVKYATSAEASGDYGRVVGYAGLIFK